MKSESKQQLAQESTNKKADEAAAAKKAQEEAAKKKAEQEAAAKKKAAEDAAAQQAAEEAAKNPNWNIQDVNADSNGNFDLAVNLLKVMGDISQKGIATNAGQVFKAPWNYYGKPVSLSGTVAIAQDYPPGSDQANAGYLSQVVFMAEDTTPVIVLSTVSSGTIEVGTDIKVVGYPIGTENVDNKLGGKTEELVIVTNKLQ